MLLYYFFSLYMEQVRGQSCSSPGLYEIKSGNTIQLDGESGLRVNPISVSDAARSVKAAMELHGSHTIKVAGPEVVSLGTVCELIGKNLGIKPNFNINPVEEKNNLVGDIDKMKESLVTPEIFLEEGLGQLLKK